MDENEINLDELVNDINLAEINDQQRVWLSQMSYLDINEEGRKKLEEGSLKASELKDYLDNPDTPYFGTTGMNDESFGKTFSLAFY